MSTTNYSVGEEIANAVTHGLGVAAAIVGLTLMLAKGIPVLNGAEIAAISVYGASLVLMFLSSTLYHSISVPKVKLILKRIDHSAIYLLIAGSYTPFMLIAIADRSAYLLLTVIWILAIAGVMFKALFIDRFKKLALATYLAMGWSSVLMIWKLIETLPSEAFNLLIIGGLCYSIGTIFYAIKSKPYFHAIWHLFVLAGASCHCVAVAAFVIPSS